MTTELAKYRIQDPIITQIVHGYAQAESIAPFIAPSVTVPTRAGQVIQFPKEQFAVLNTRRAPRTAINRIGATFSAVPYQLVQHAMAAEVALEEYEEAMNGPANIDLRSLATIRASQALMQAWEADVVSTITNSALYESSCTSAISAANDKWDDVDSDPEKLVYDIREAVRAQVGVYPNSAVISPKVFNALKRHPIFRDRLKYTSTASVTTDMLAQWFELPRGVKVATRSYLTPAGTLVDFMDEEAVFFYNPDGPIGNGFMPLEGADKAVPAYAYTYILDGYPLAYEERFDETFKTFVTDIIFEQSLQLVGLGETGKCGAGYLLTNILT